MVQVTYLHMHAGGQPQITLPPTPTMMFFSFNTANCPTEVVGAVRLLQVWGDLRNLNTSVQMPQS